MSVLLNGSSDYLVGASSAAHGVGTGAFTMFAAVKPTSIASAVNQAACQFGSAPSFCLLLRTGAVNKLVAYPGGVNAFTNGLTNNVWQLIAWTRSAGGSNKGWINGVQEAATFSDSSSMADASPLVGCFVTPANGVWAGLVERVGLYNVELSAAEIAALAGGVDPRGIQASALKLYWSLDQMSGTVTNGQAGLAAKGGLSVALQVGGGAPVWSGDTMFPPRQDGMLMRAAALGVL